MKFGHLAFALAPLTLLAFANASQAQKSALEVWLGAPFDGNWPDSSGCKNGTAYTCSLPVKHWTEYGGQWSVDLPAPATTEVKLFAAPEGSGSIKAKVDSVGEACLQGRKGGKVVRVGIFADGRRVGALAYSHLVTSLKKGDEVTVWGGRLGTLFETTERHEQCWMGPHLHLEVAASNGFSCYNKGFRPGQRTRQTNFLGFITGQRASATRSACP